MVLIGYTPAIVTTSRILKQLDIFAKNWQIKSHLFVETPWSFKPAWMAIRWFGSDLLIVPK